MILFFTFTFAVFFLEFLGETFTVVGLTGLDAVRGESRASYQNVFIYIAGANGARNEEMRQTRKSYMNQKLKLSLKLATILVS